MSTKAEMVQLGLKPNNASSKFSNDPVLLKPRFKGSFAAAASWNDSGVSSLSIQPLISALSVIIGHNESVVEKTNKKILPDILIDSFVHTPPKSKSIVHLKIKPRTQRIHYISEEVLFDPEDC